MHAPISQPSAWITRFAGLVPPGEVLDLACGHGRHALLLAALGYPVLAVDRDPDALAGMAQMEGIVFECADLESGHPWPYAENRFSAIVQTNYLHRPLFPFMLRSLAPGGVLLVETFAQGNGQFGKPSNPDFLLAPGELLELTGLMRAGSLRVVAFEDGYFKLPKPAMVQRICLVKLPADGPSDPKFPLN